jgi:hypothetical protein
MAKRDGVVRSAKKITAPEFIRQYIKMQTELMDGMVQLMMKGEIQLDETDADVLIDTVMNQWLAQEDPDFAAQMQAQAAMFLDELLEAYYAASHGADDRFPAAQSGQPQGPSPVMTITMDVLKTIRAVWGRPA